MKMLLNIGVIFFAIFGILLFFGAVDSAISGQISGVKSIYPFASSIAILNLSYILRKQQKKSD